MKPKSLSLRTDLMFWRHDGRVLDRGEYLVIETPSNPGYYWGNLLVFDRPPGGGDVERWRELFEREFHHQPAVRHMTFQWDTTTGELGNAREFVDLGFRLSMCHVLVTQRVQRPPHFNNALRIDTVDRAADWNTVLETKVAIARPEHEATEYRGFVERRLADFRTMLGAGAGNWFGAYLGDRLVGDCGVFCDGELARFQEVVTHPDHRCQGVCATLVCEAARRTLAEPEVDQLVIVADDDEFQSASVYRSVGFTDREQIPGLCRYPDQR